MLEHANHADETLKQSVHDRSVIEHLISTFHANGHGSSSGETGSTALYMRIRREWSPESSMMLQARDGR